MKNVHSATLCPIGILSMLYATEKYIDKESIFWHGESNKQRQIVEMYDVAQSELASGISDVKTFAGSDCLQLNGSLKDHGYSIRLPHFVALDIGAVAFFDAAVKFDPVGVPTEMLIDGKRVPSVTIQVGPTCWWGPHSKLPAIVEISTKGDENVYLIPCEQELSGLELYDFVAVTLQNRNQLRKTDQGVCFPMTNIKHIPDVCWLEGMTILGSDNQCMGVLRVALQENSLAIDHRGARVRSATAGLTYRSITQDIDVPYVFVLVRDDMIHFVALCGQDSWRNPADKNPLILEDILTMGEG